MSNASIADRARKVLFQNYKQQPIALVRGLGAKVWDADGKEYVDFLGGIAVTALGHNHPSVRRAVEAQLEKLWHVSNVYFTEPQVSLAERIVATGAADRVFFANSGAEANEGALKLIRRYQFANGKPNRTGILAAKNSFHGRTMGALSATGQPKYHEGFAPLVPGITHLPFGDLQAFEQAVTEETAGIIVECIQGESGVVVPPEGFLAGLRALADRHGLVLVFDEVQGGLGRTGRMWSFDWEGVQPDAFTLAKALGNGLPVAALCAKERFAEVLVPGTHASTFGGNPVTCAAACAVFDELVEGGALARGQVVAERLWQGLAALQAKSSGAIELVRGRGLWIGVVLAEPKAGDVVTKAREAGLLVGGVGDRVLRLAPALITGDVEIDRGLELLGQAIAAV